MSVLNIVPVLFVLLIGTIGIASCRVHYIIPTEGEPCFMESCLTLSQFAETTIGYVDSNVTIFIMGGNHYLDKTFSLSNVKVFSMISINYSLSTSSITCANHAAHFTLTNNRQVYVHGIEFIGCNGNIVRSVDLLTIVGSRFVNSSSTPWTITDSHVNMEQCTFAGNSMGKNRNDIRYLQVAFREEFSGQESVGGALIVENSTLTIDNCQFLENKANIGGAIFTESESKLIISDSTFAYNRATDCDNRLCLGGVLFVTGTPSSTIIQNCSFHNNTSGQFGGVAVIFNTNLVTSTNTVTKNSSSGGIEADLLIELNFKVCTFGNNAAGSGGVVYLYESNVFIRDCNFQSNTAEEVGGVIASNASSSVIIIGCHFMFNKASGLSGGGGVVNIQHKSALQIESSVLEHSSVEGGVIFANHNCSVTIENCTLTNNSAKDDGGVAFIGYYSTATISASTFSNNSANDNAGVLFVKSHSSATVVNSIFVQNEAVNHEGVALATEWSIIRIDRCTFSGNMARLKAGVITAKQYSSAIINGSSFGHNRAGESGGAVHIKGESTAVIKMSTFNNNCADDGAVINVNTNSTATINQSIFVENRAGITGGVISSKQKTLITIINSTFIKNTALDIGSVVYLEERTNVTIHNCFFTNNSGGYGGVLAAKRSCDIFISDSNFQYNVANVDGGCIYARTMCTTTIVSSLITKNTAKNNGILLVNDNSFIRIDEDTFVANEVGHDGAAIYVLDRSTIFINNSNFTNNKANNSGGIVNVRKYSNITIENSFMHDNTAENSGGAVCGLDGSYVSIQDTHFANNRADYGGVLRMYISSKVNISSCFFSENRATIGGGVITVYKHSKLTVQDSVFTFNTATYGGVFIAYPNTQVSFVNNRCNNNKAKSGGAIRVLQESRVDIIGSNFSNNTAEIGGVVWVQQGNMNIEESWLEHNGAKIEGGAVYADYYSTIRIEMSVFFNNTAEAYGGAISLLDSICTAITSCNFTSNTAAGGGTINQQNSSVNIYRSAFLSSQSRRSGGIVQALSSTVNVNDSIFADSIAAAQGGGVFAHYSSSLVIFNTTFSKNIANGSGGALFLGTYCTCLIIESVFQGNKAKVQGGAIAVSGDSIVNISESVFRINEAKNGGGLACTESSVISFQSASTSKTKENTLSNNTAKDGDGGGIYLADSVIYFTNNTTIGRNKANHSGGGVMANNSTLFIGSPVNILSNWALQSGGGVSLANSKINGYSEKAPVNFTFDANHAHLGEALYVDDDDINSAVCSSDPLLRPYSKLSGCFFSNVTNGLHFRFVQDIAIKTGSSTIYGGLMDRCTVASFSNDSKLEQTAIDRFKEITNISEFNVETVTSKPVRVCSCKNGKPNCNQGTCTLGPVFVKKGNKFTIELAAVDQVNHSVNATIQSKINDGASLNKNETVRRLDSKCSTLDYHATFPEISKIYDLQVFAEGPCRGEGISTLIIKIEVIPCSCKAGFMQEQVSTKCSCICDKKDKTFSKYIKECDSTLEAVKRKGEFWITYLNYSDNNSFSPYFIYPYCPLGYCESPSTEIFINLSQPNGSDAQCANNRRGILCGSCKPNHSLSLGNLKCIKCPHNWHKLLAIIIVISIVAGILLVILLLVLNLTVAIGTINSMVFYTNIIFANRSIFFNHWQLQFTFVPVFVSWLNMNIGFDICFYDGMDAYVKTWLQLAFPVYIFFLVVTIIWFTSCSSKLSNLLGRRNPVATLATLILLSYTNLLENIIKSFSFVKLNYPNGTATINWLPDASYEYKDWKIILLTCVAIVILILGLLYTILIFSWQWLIRYSRSKCFRWTGNQKLHTFIDTYHTPYTAKHRYWTGLLLLVRVVVYLTSAFSLPVNPRITLLTTAVIMCSLLLYKSILKVRVYKNRILNAMESFAFFNIAIFVFITWFNFDNPSITTSELLQMVAAYVSVGAMFLLFIFVLMYHLYRYGNSTVYSFCQGTKFAMKLNDRLSCNQDHEHPTQFDGNSYRLFDTMDTPRDSYNDGDSKTSNLRIPLREGPTRSSVSLNNCSESSSNSLSETPQSKEF